MTRLKRRKSWQASEITCGPEPVFYSNEVEQSILAVTAESKSTFLHELIVGD